MFSELAPRVLPEVELCAEEGCLLRTRWRLMTADARIAGRLVSGFVSSGWLPTDSGLPGLATLRWEGHRLLFIPTTGRLELRIGLDIPLDERRLLAQQLVSRAALAAGISFVAPLAAGEL